ncbi:hypothetical protein ACLOJK_012828 [Asimina triloba]
MFPQFGATAESLSKASAMVFRIGTDAHLYDDPEDVSIAPLLDSRFDYEKSQALKRLLALIAQGFDVSNFFPQVGFLRIPFHFHGKSLQEVDPHFTANLNVKNTDLFQLFVSTELAPLAFFVYQLFVGRPFGQVPRIVSIENVSKALKLETGQDKYIPYNEKHVVKNVASQSLEVKKLVYLYLLHYAEKRPNEALLSINCFQKDLSDTNPLVRAWALRAMAGIRLHVIAPLVLAAITKCSRDPSPYVRKCAANALPKLYDIRQEENVSALEELVGVLLTDHSPGVVGAAAAAFNSVCPNNLSLIGRNFKRLCETLPDVEEWGQILLIEILLRYVVARHGLVRESLMLSSYCSRSSPSEKDAVDTHVLSDGDCKFLGSETSSSNFTALLFRYYIEGPDEYLPQSSHSVGDMTGLESAIFTSAQNSDVKVLLLCTSPLLWSQNSAVVLAAAGVHWIMAPREDVKKIAKPILFLLRKCDEIDMQSSIGSKDERLMLSRYRRLGLLTLDSDYIKDSDRRFVADTVAAIGLCAQRLPNLAKTCLEGLLALTTQDSSISACGSMIGEADILSQAIMSIKAIIKQNPANHEKVIIQLARSLDVIKVPAARAMIVWMVGEYGSVGPNIARVVTIVLRYLAGCFTKEDLETKHQILNTVTKVVLFQQGEDLYICKMVLNYVLELAKYDLNYDLRDRARVINKLLARYVVSQSKEDGNVHLLENEGLQNKLVEGIFSGKTKATLDAPNNCRFYLPGSLSQVVLHAAPGYLPLPRPCSVHYDDLSQLEKVGQGTKKPHQGTDNSESVGTNDPDTLSGSVNEESASSYNSQGSITSLDDSDGTGSASDHGHDTSLLVGESHNDDDKIGPFFRASDASIGIGEANVNSLSQGLGELMSKKALESWLAEKPFLSEVGPSNQEAQSRSSARISVRDIGVNVKPKVHMLLDPSSGNGLKVEYSFSAEVSHISSLLVCVEVSFQNCSTKPLTEITMKDEESDGSSESSQQVPETFVSSLTLKDVPVLVPMEEIASLAPGQMAKRILQVRFHHHLLPLKLAVCHSGNKHAVKLRPDIGYFIKPLSMDFDAFTNKESLLPGMFVYTRRCTFADHIEDPSFQDDPNSSFKDDKFLVVCRSLASKMLSNVHAFLVYVDMPVTAGVDDVSGLCLRFSSEILSNSIPCLITVLAEGKCSQPLDILVKINCEETVFGLNLLNRVVAILSSAALPA